MPTAPRRKPVSARDRAAVSHNLVGQRLGRKGQATRERILDAMLRLLADPEGPPVTLTGVAREAGIGLSNLYLYFPDLGELLLAALRKVTEDAESEHVERLRRRWPDDGLEAACREFLGAHFAFWRQHARLLHMRNAMADANDLRILNYRQSATQPLLAFLAAQMTTGESEPDRRHTDLATVLFTGLERMATVLTHGNYDLISGHMNPGGKQAHAERLLDAEATVMALTVRTARDQPA